MKYKNEKLQVTIESAGLFEIVERPNHIELRADGVTKFHVIAKSTVRAYDSSTVEAYDSSTVEAFDSSTVEAYDSSTVMAYDSSTVVAHDSSSVVAYDSSTVVAFGSSSVEAFGSSLVEAFDSSTVVAHGFCCVFVKSGNSKVKPEKHFGAIIQQVFKATKKTIVFKKLQDNLIAELVLSKGQIFQSENHGKCRTDRAEVLSITDVDGKKYLEGHSTHDHTFVYTVGAVVSAPYDKEVKECSTGIHFFLTREEAERY